MNQFIIIATDSLRAVGTNACHPDTIVCKMISSQETSSASINLTLVIITALIAVVLLALIFTNYCLQKMRLQDETKKREDQHKWDVEDEDRRRKYKNEDGAVSLTKAKINNQ